MPAPSAAAPQCPTMMCSALKSPQCISRIVVPVRPPSRPASAPLARGSSIAPRRRISQTRDGGKRSRREAGAQAAPRAQPEGRLLPIRKEREEDHRERQQDAGRQYPGGANRRPGVISPESAKATRQADAASDAKVKSAVSQSILNKARSPSDNPPSRASAEKISAKAVVSSPAGGSGRTGFKSPAIRLAISFACSGRRPRACDSQRRSRSRLFIRRLPRRTRDGACSNSRKRS